MTGKDVVISVASSFELSSAMLSKMAVSGISFASSPALIKTPYDVYYP
jgi:hypothetical protein